MSRSRVQAIPLPIIPPELCDTIIEFVHDQATLKSCALVSRSSLRTSQRRLFSTIRLNPPNFFQLERNSCERFYNVISKSPHLATYVRHLFIIDGHHEINPILLLDTEYVRWKGIVARMMPCHYMWIAEEMTLPKVLSKLANLRSLTVHGPGGHLKWNNLSPETQNALFAVVKQPQLTKLELLGTFGFIPLLRSVMGLKYLSFLGNDMSWQERSSMPDTGSQICRLDSLDVAFGLDHVIMDIEGDSWLDLSRLRSLVLRGDVVRTRIDLVFPKRILEFSETLEHLYLYLDSTVPFRLLTSLASFPRLRSFYLDARHYIAPTLEPYHEWFTKMLYTIPDTSQVETIAFRLSFTQPLDLFTQEGYTKLDLALIRPELQSLISVRANIGKVGEMENSIYHSRLPLISARNILSIERDSKWVAEYDSSCSGGCRYQG